MGFLLKIAANAGSLAIAARWINGFEITPHAFLDPALVFVPPLIQSFVVGGAVLAVLNKVLHPVLKVLSFPAIILTFGLFNIIINIAILFLADWYLVELTVHGLQALFLGSLLLGVVNSIFK